ncbi:sugar phosphate nucleotidyltransferase [Synechococcus sp. PCC 6312]|uniref:sugar phosphate nucleotidyltransferase n=1 Tax=Synechococcus sp. (strain ATCC 27167 / PCC 6312) TaxID=195253 RepID=UPI00029F1411|nr:NDP-sugar synthase [Synechococcus sp. PCC 6312]AFY60804.1 Nucleoside-diphosphate-sugar pyrophosphorylase family protein [Synechococcus sp. PCC 6312]
MQAVIIAGGKGTRMAPLTQTTPKPMLPLLDRPFLAWMVERCRAVGIRDILINVHYHAHQIEDYFGDGRAWGVQIRYLREEIPLDTAGAMKLAEPYFTGDSLLVFNADILTDLDLQQLIDCHQTAQAQATLALTRVSNPTAFGLVELAETQGGVNQVVAFREKPTPEQAAELGIDTINAGTYVLEPGIFAQYDHGQPLSFERTVFPQLLAQSERMAALIWEGYWQDLGTPQKYYQAHLDSLAGIMPYPIAEYAREIAPQVWAAPTAEVHAQAILKGPSYIGEKVKIGANAIVPEGTVIGQASLVDRPLEPGIYPAGTLAI